MKLHVISLPHTRVNRKYEWCAYTSKTRKFCKMMVDEGHEVVLYSPSENADVPESVQRIALPNGQKRVQDGYHTPPGDKGVIIPFNDENEWFKPFNEAAVQILNETVEDHDFICILGGLANKPIAESIKRGIKLEYGIGYNGIIPDAFHIYESYAWMHSVFASNHVADTLDGRFFDTVIPNFFETKDFPMGTGKGDNKGEYLLYVGRFLQRKGLQIAIETAYEAGKRLVVAGFGDYEFPGWVERRGIVGPKQRAELMGNATALIAPTLYLEPFGGVVVEAQLCGTPVITTDWGAFPETVEQGRTGFRCHTLAEFVKATDDVTHLSRNIIRRRARKLYSTETIAPLYTAHFNRLQTLWDRGFYQGAQYV